MDSNHIFKKYYSRLAREGTLKALICGFIAGFTLSLIPAIITIVANYNGLWISLGIIFAVALVSTPLFYCVFFRPKIKQIAERIDRLGLDERCITMIELEKDESYIAMRQREDAKEKLKLGNRRIKFSIFKAPIIALVVVAICSVSTIAVSATSVESPQNWTQPEDWQLDKNSYRPINYVVDESQGFAGGYIGGYANQLGIDGYTSTAIAIADVGYVFSEWSDGVETAERTDKYVQDEITVSAIFVVQEESAQSQNPEPTTGENTENPTPTEDNSRYDAANQVVDGDTYYRDVYQDMYNAAKEAIAGGREISAETRAILEAYYGIII